MKKAEMKEIVKSNIDGRNLCRMYFRYDYYYRYYFPLISNEKLFLCIEEDDFMLDGYTIRRFVDITKVQNKNDKCIEILKSEGIINSIEIPDVDISSWETVFASLQKMNRNIIVEHESLNNDEMDFYIGRISKVFKKFIYFYHFDADGIWDDEPYKILYTDITSVSFGTRYVDTFSKYVGEPPHSLVKEVSKWQTQN